MTPKRITPELLCGTPLNIQPLAWAELTETDAFLYRVMGYPLIDEDAFTPAYKEGGTRPGTSPALLLSLNLYRTQHQLGLDEAMRQLHFNQECQLFVNALGMCREDMPESDRILSRFQSRVKDYAESSGTPNVIDATYQMFTVACCALTGADLAVLRSDSTNVSGNFKVRTGEELMYVALRAAIDYLNAYGTEEQKAALHEGRLDKYNDLVFSENVFNYHWAASKEERRETLCKDADALLNILTPEDQAVESIHLTVRVIDEHTVVGADGKRTFRAKGDDVLKGNLIQSLLDENASYRIKDGKQFWGYSLNIVEERNPLTHIIINSILRPNRAQDSNMENEAYAQVPEFAKKLDEFYAQYPALIKGDPLACQSVVADVIQSLKTDFLNETSKLYELIQGHASDEEVRSQQKKALAVLDTFYTRLKGHDPMPSESLDEETPANDVDATPGNGAGTSKPSVSANGNITSTTGDPTPGNGNTINATGESISGNNTTNIIVKPTSGNGNGASGNGNTATQGTTSLNGGIDICRRTATDWGHIGDDAIDWNNPAFANLSDKVRRNYYLAMIAAMPENAFDLPVNQNISVSDAAYSPSAEKAKEAGYTLFTTNLLGQKGSPITVLFKQEGGTYVACPKGNTVVKQSLHTNGTVSLWIKKSCCEGCPCAADCKAKSQKRGDLAVVQINPHAFPAIISEAKMATDSYQCLGDIRNGCECTMSVFKNVYHCDDWPIGMAIKDRMSKDMVMSANLRNLFLAVRGASRVHPNKLFGKKDDLVRESRKAKAAA